MLYVENYKVYMLKEKFLHTPKSYCPAVIYLWKQFRNGLLKQVLLWFDSFFHCYSTSNLFTSGSTKHR